jgi:glycosyltransferase involved in cell wall biosynthesis
VNNLYVTCDRLGTPTGGGAVTHHEFQAMMKLGAVTPVTDMGFADPFRADDILSEQIDSIKDVTLAHFYAGSFTRTIKKLKARGTKVTYTAAAHDVQLSKGEHEKLGLGFNYPHLTEPALWERYVGGYLEADLLICPSTHSAEVKKKYGRTGPTNIIPHGTDIPQTPPAPLPPTFTVGYLGAIGPDKGLVYLLQAWREAGLKDASLVLAGAHSCSDYVKSLIASQFAVSYYRPDGSVAADNCDIRLLGWQDNIKDFYDNVSLYVQPSITEGFGIEVLEAMAYGRPVLCSTGAGAADLVPGSWRFPAGDVTSFAHKLRQAHAIISVLKGDDQAHWLAQWKESATPYSWGNVEEQYIKAWEEVLK